MTRVIANKYEELEQLGQGGQGVVYKARQVDNKTILALKILPSYLLENPEMVARFEQEALLMTRMRHRNIVRVLGSGRDDALKSLYIVMEHVQGKTLRQYLQDKGPLPLAEVLEITRQIAGALHYAHTQVSPVIHRDIKPTNIMIEDISGRVVVLDFGIAKELGDGEGAKTKTGVMVGTWKYSSPEQLRHEPLTGSADVYSVGMVMYEMYTGTQFYGGLEEYAVLGKVLYDEQEHEPSFSRPTPPGFVELVRKAIAKSRAKRYAGMADLLNDLETCWLTLDETRTIILPTPGSVASLPRERALDDVEKIEEQIRKLQDERQRLIVVTTQQQARDAKKQAERDGAQQWAPNVFQQGLSQEEEGEVRLQEQHYALAQEAFRSALNLFTQAREAAVATALFRQTEQARQGAKTAKADADRYDARARAHTGYRRASTLQEQAEELWAQKNYEPARQNYTEARSLFEDARDLAYHETLKEEAEAARVLARATREKAISEGSETFAGAILQEAAAVEQQAAAALKREDFTQARTLYEVANQKYQQAQRQARTEQRRQEVAAVAQQVQRVRQCAVGEGIQEDHRLYQQGVAAQLRAESYVAVQDYTRAEREYARAQTQYEAAAQEVELERQQRTVHQARQQMTAAQATAQSVQADQRLMQEWETVLQRVAAAEADEARQAFTQAAAGYEQARHRFEQLAQEARVQQERETLVEAHQRVAEAKAYGQRLRAWGEAVWTAAEAVEAQAEQAETRGAYEQAIEGYRRAEQAYHEARQQAEDDRESAWLQRLTTAQTEATKAKTAAEATGAQDATPSLYHQGLTLLQQAKDLWEQREYESSGQQYEEARLTFDRALTLAQHEALRKEVHVLRTQVQAARAATEKEESAVLTTETWQEAVRTEQQADAFLQQEEIFRARELYQATFQQYVRIEQEVRTERQRQEAATLAQQTLMAKEAAKAVETWQGSSLTYRRADEAWRQAEEYFSNRNYFGASQHYSQARELYAESAREGERQYHRQAAVQARQQLELARTAATQAKAELYIPVEWTETQALVQSAQQREAHEDFESAATRYRQATQRFTQLQQEALVHEQRTKAEAARQHMLAVKTQGETFAEWAPKDWAEAQAREAQATVAYQTQEYRRATEEYEGARQIYLRAKEYAEAERRQQEAEQQAALLLLQQTERLREITEKAKAEQEIARQESVRSRLEAEESGAAELAPDLYRQALALQTQAEEDRERQAYAQAKPHYEEASQVFNAARVLARRTRLQREIDSLRVRVQAAREAAEKEDAAILAPISLQAAIRTEQQAASALQREEWSNAERLYNTACEEYKSARQQAVTERQRQQVLRVAQQRQTVLQARQHMEEAQATAERVGAAQRFVADWRILQQQVEVAQQNERREELDQAATLYSQLQQRFEGLQQEAERQIAEEKAQRRQRVLLARQQAEQSSREAELAQAQSYAPEQYAEAILKTREGEQRFAAQDWERAEALFLQAQELSGCAFQRSQQEKAKQTAQKMQERALIAQREARDGRSGELFPRQFEEASSLIHAGQQDLEREQFALAQASFEKGLLLFQQIVRDAALVVTRQQQVAQEKAVNAVAPAEVPLTPAKTSKSFVLLSGAALLVLAIVGLYVASPFRWLPQKTASLPPPVGEVIFPAARPLVEAGHDTTPRETTETIPPPPSYAKDELSLSTKSSMGGAQKKQPEEIAETETSSTTSSPTTKPPLTTTAPQADAQLSHSSSEKKLEPEEFQLPLQSQEIAKVSPPQSTPLLLKPPSITQVSPKPGEEVSIAEGEKLAFAVDAQSDQPRTLYYTWFLNGEKRAEGKKWSYQPDYEEGGKSTKQVKVVVTDGKTAPVEQNWIVQVHDVDRPPAITGTTPKAGTIEVALGETLGLSVQAVDPDKDDSLLYIWSVDGKEAIRGDHKSWQLPASADNTPRSVRVEVIDKAGKGSQVAWNVSLKAPILPPRIISAEPEKDDLVLQTGRTIDFSVRATLAEENDNTKKKLSYQWTVNGTPLRAGDNGDLLFNETRPGTYRVSVVAISQKGQKSSPREWKVEVRPLEIAPPPPPSQLSAAEVSSWLETYRRAWEGKDVETLVTLGAISSQEARNLQAVLSSYKEFRVAFTEVDVQREADQTKISFKRIDTIEGRNLPHPDRIALTLEKRPDGRIVIHH